MPRRLPLALFALALVAPSSARADLPPPEENMVCADKKVGDACELSGARGACVSDSCSRLDYSNGTPPETVSYECLRCQPGVAAKGPAPAEEAPPAAEAVAAGAPAPAEPTATGKSGCNVAGSAEAAPLLLIALVGGLARRRRHR